ncbi:Ribosomal protein S18 acetylase RimI [Chitinophaga sp. YR573]|uniref:GNAT family N-acetyltransferase n=1 Tax=Chitinophaga sp. YR573 TaxID=1881040 RepID=UPI0008B8263E|nr:GNAT family N-acetyltransferase [Chitinophaga sp. YR573]SEV99891.1 Ribosomal protein S18 acetylase RimI [Chitinophaga sp. YR573]
MITISTLQVIPSEIASLYELSFPIEERRNLSAQQELLEAGALQLQIVKNDDIFAGFVFCWVLTDFIFIEHFAIDTSQRGGGIGSKVMTLLQAQYPRIVLEVEPPHSTDAERRIRFYESLGFQSYPYIYRQPSYLAGGAPLEMLLMQTGMSAEEDTFSGISIEIYREVYGI